MLALPALAGAARACMGLSLVDGYLAVTCGRLYIRAHLKVSLVGGACDERHVQGTHDAVSRHAEVLDEREAYKGGDACSAAGTEFAPAAGHSVAQAAGH